jgi:hypothetical protein
MEHVAWRLNFWHANDKLPHLIVEELEGTNSFEFSLFSFVPSKNFDADE